MSGPPRRHHNVFFAYRGPATGDREISAGKQIEDNITRALIITLEHVDASSVSGFVSALTGLDVATPTRWDVHLQVPPAVAGDGPLVLLGISPVAGIQDGTLRRAERGSRPDAALILDGGLTVVVESKAVGKCHGAQLWNHAVYWGMEVEERPEDAPIPSNWSLRSWDDVAEWTRNARATESGEVGRFLLDQFEEYLTLAGVVTSDRAPEVTKPERSVPNVDPTSQRPLDLDLVDRLEREVDLARVAALCTELYGTQNTSFYVSGDKSGPEDPRHCSHDVAVVLQAYRDAGLEPPAGLLGRPKDTTTPRRSLGLLFGPDGFQQTIADPQTYGMARKYLALGVDRAVLLGWLSWASGRGGVRPTYVRQIVAAAWPDAPIRSPAAPELHDGLGEDAAFALLME